ncbi:MAG: hypothetical protein ACK5HR_00350 [Mycoplasmatales bacterium]
MDLKILLIHKRIATGERNGGVGVYQHLIDTTKDFNINYIIKTNGVENKSGVSILLSDVSNIGYVPENLFVTSRVFGNTNSTYIGLVLIVI